VSLAARPVIDRDCGCLSPAGAVGSGTHVLAAIDMANTAAPITAATRKQDEDLGTGPRASRSRDTDLLKECSGTATRAAREGSGRGAVELWKFRRITRHWPHHAFHLRPREDWWGQQGTAREQGRTCGVAWTRKSWVVRYAESTSSETGREPEWISQERAVRRQARRRHWRAGPWLAPRNRTRARSAAAARLVPAAALGRRQARAVLRPRRRWR